MTTRSKTSKKTSRSKSTAKPHATKTTASETQIRRSYKGHELVVDVVDGQFIIDGVAHKSLTALARSVVGYGISGPHFFRMSMPKPGKLTGGK